MSVSLTPPRDLRQRKTRSALVKALLELLEEAQRGNEDPDTLINGLLQAATEFYDADSHILSKRIGRQALA